MSQFSYKPQNLSVKESGTERLPKRIRPLREINTNAVITLAPAGTDADAGEGRGFNLGRVNRESVGYYRVEAQAVTGGVALGSSLGWMDFIIREHTAGVFVCEVPTAVEGGTATNDAADPTKGIASFTAGTAMDLSSSAGNDTALNFKVCVAGDVTELAAGGNSVAASRVSAAVNDLIVYDTLAAATHRIVITRMS
jgi:hypothetical protein